MKKAYKKIAENLEKDREFIMYLTDNLKKDFYPEQTIDTIRLLSNLNPEITPSRLCDHYPNGNIAFKVIFETKENGFATVTYYQDNDKPSLIELFPKVGVVTKHHGVGYIEIGNHLSNILYTPQLEVKTA